MRNLSLCGLLLMGVVAGWLPARAQRVHVPLNADYYDLVERYEIKSGRWARGFHGHVKPYWREAIVQLADSVTADSSARLSWIDTFNLQYLRDDSWEWSADSATSPNPRPLFGALYQRRPAAYSVRNDDVTLTLNPVLYLGLGVGQNVPQPSFVNTRGVEVRGAIGRKLGFYTYLSETQMRLPTYVGDRIVTYDAVPGEGFYKQSGQTGNDNITNVDAVDFLTARGYLSFDPIRQINVQFGHDKVFIGPGYRSMILSDYSAPYLFLKLTTQIGRVQYQNLFTEIITNERDIPYGQLPPKRYMAHHHLSVNLTDHVNVGVFETVIHTRGKDQGYFDLNYLNPLIFYRAIEQQRKSADNVVLGLDWKVNFLRRFLAYGQLLLDEFKISELRDANGWWGNKFAVQVGTKYVDAFGLSNLDLQAEVNLAKPYTYQHQGTLTSYVHYNQPLAHPLGANFVEFIGTARYQPLERLQLGLTFMAANYGTDPAYGDDPSGRNFGGNPLLSYVTRAKDYGNYIGQGIGTVTYLADLTATYQLWHNVFAEFRQIIRQQNSALPRLDQGTAYTSLTLRINTPRRLLTF
jgi:hypothetical protein